MSVAKEHNYVVIELTAKPQRTHKVRGKENLKRLMMQITGCTEGEARYDARILARKNGHVFVRHGSEAYELSDIDLVAFNNLSSTNALHEVTDTVSTVRSFRVSYNKTPFAYNVITYLKEHRALSEQMAKDFAKFVEDWAREHLTEEIKLGIIETEARKNSLVMEDDE